jgi:hypothetical protein
MLCSNGFLCGAILFGEPSMLWWLWAACVPLVIPWLVLRTPRPTRFAAMEIVARARARQPLPRRLIRLAGPLLRAGMLALVILALARPEFRPSPRASADDPDPDGHVAFLTGGSGGDVGIPPLLAAVRATAAVECRLLGTEGTRDAQPGSGPARVDLTAARGIVLCDGAVLDAIDRERVARFVERGGTAVILLGPASLSEPQIAATAALSRRLGGPPLADRAGLPFTSEADDAAGAAIEIVSGAAGAAAAPSDGVRFAGVFVPLEGPRIRRWARLDAGLAGPSARGSEGHGPRVIARVRRTTGVEPTGVLLRRAAGLVAFVGIPLDLPGLAEGSWQSVDADAGWDDVAAWPAFIDVTRRVFVPIMTAQAAARAAAGEPSSGALAGSLLLLAIVAAVLDPLVGLWGTGRSGR